ncbi:MAG: hypothetical protein EBX50_22100, partial [Chitinophagia bacterium]|nr:hypothetical protein [Chitinophagia bacterium]
GLYPGRPHERRRPSWLQPDGGVGICFPLVTKIPDQLVMSLFGELRLLELYDGWYVVGEGRLIPVKDEEEGFKIIMSLESLNLLN